MINSPSIVLKISEIFLLFGSMAEMAELSGDDEEQLVAVVAVMMTATRRVVERMLRQDHHQSRLRPWPSWHRGVLKPSSSSSYYYNVVNEVTRVGSKSLLRLLST